MDNYGDKVHKGLLLLVIHINFCLILRLKPYYMGYKTIGIHYGTKNITIGDILLNKFHVKYIIRVS